MSFKNYFIIASFIIACTLFLNSCKKGGGFQTTPDGLRYKFFKQDKNGVKAQLGDMIIFQIQQRSPNDSIIYDSYKNEMGAASMIFPEYPHKASFVEGLTLMSKGDSVLKHSLMIILYNLISAFSSS